ncbi:hypothetical protein BT96DRAFT_556231 [Gymnopus androsaceus JB14]|uniref:Uncharacterized protein n=1 Tax=Gymnopus androsaceus JB14 TaxID=1447944 RepID=A0A6A4HVN3_9AGAR|nr:hypothetical protein BT96DRAFT_556231 [Gymnopus androsaceus JB14]
MRHALTYVLNFTYLWNRLGYSFNYFDIPYTVNPATENFNPHPWMSDYQTHDAHHAPHNEVCTRATMMPLRLNGPPKLPSRTQPGAVYMASSWNLIPRSMMTRDSAMDVSVKNEIYYIS